MATSTPQSRGRTFNTAVTKFWSAAAPLYDIPQLQQLIYRPPQSQVISHLVAHGARKIVDVACGTGILTDRIEREVDTDEVYGVDMADGMLAKAKDRSERVTWLKGSAEHLPFDDAALDAVVTTSAFHFFDQPAALAEFHRVLAPGGLVAVGHFTTWQPLPLKGISAGLLNPMHNAPAEEVRQLFVDAGFSIVEQRRVRRPVWTALVPDYVTVGMKPA